MEQLLNLYKKAKKLNNIQLIELIRSGDYKGQTAGLSKNMLQTNLIILEKILTRFYNFLSKKS